MKLNILILLFLTANLYGQQGGFTKILPLDKQTLPSQVIELRNKNYLCIVSSVFDTLVRNKTKLVIYSPKGIALDSMVFSAPDKDLNIYKVVETAYGVCLMGVMKKDTATSFWVVNLNNQWQIINEQFKPLLQGQIFDINYVLDRDSTIIMMFQYKWDATVLTSFAKINKKGEIIVVKNIVGPSGQSYPRGIVATTDSSRYNFIYYEGSAVYDTSFNNRKVYYFSFPSEIGNRYPYISGVLIKNDSTFLFAGDITRVSYKTNAFFAIIKNNRYTNFRETTASGDTSYATAAKRSIDTTKDGRFIYIGDNYNYQESIFYIGNSFLKLTKMDSNYNVIWAKNYGGDANYRLTGITATSDGGCIMYAARHNHNNLEQVDVILIKVDGNGLITSTNSIPITQSSITAYPNPSTGQLNFKKETPSVASSLAMTERFDVSIFDMSGKLVFQKKETDLSETIDLAQLAEGSYMYQIQQQGIIKAIGKWVKTQ
jgi:Secretion system C-terminal sorting domain